MKKGIDAKALVACLLIVYFIAFLGSLFTFNAVRSEWYISIRPSITPPNWVFPVVWNVLFLLIALSLYFSWTNSGKNEKARIIAVFGINFLANVLWSLLYFKMQNPLLAFYDIVVLLISIMLMIAVLWKIEKKSSLLLVPYFLWVSFASVLNYLSIM